MARAIQAARTAPAGHLPAACWPRCCLWSSRRWLERRRIMALPVITSLAPISGPANGGTIVTLSGTGFTGALAVGFGATNASTLSVISDTTMVAVSPAGTGTVNVTVITPGGISAVNAAVQFGYAGDTSTASSAGYYVDPAITSQIVGSLINLVQSNNSPDAIAAQNILMRRLALEGDVVGSRIPP